MSSWLGLGKSSTEKENTPSASNNNDTLADTQVSSFLSPDILDPAKLHPLAGLNSGTLQYLDLEEEALTSVPGGTGIIPIKDWTDDLCYGTGVVYLAGLGLGGAYGLAEGLRKTEGITSPKLRLNGVLNAITRRGPFLGNTAGVLALTYNLVNSSIDYYRGKHEWTNSVAAGALSGALFRITRGPKQIAIASGMMASAAGVWCVIKRQLF